MKPAELYSYLSFCKLKRFSSHCVKRCSFIHLKKISAIQVQHNNSSVHDSEEEWLNTPHMSIATFISQN